MKKATITEARKYPANYKVYWQGDDNENGIIDISTDGLIDGTYYEDNGDDNYIEEGFEQYAINEATERLASMGYRITDEV